MPPPARLLVVDDDGVGRKVLALALEEEGFTVETAASGGSALAWLARNTPSLVLLDLVMPPPDGYAVLRSLRADPRTAEVPVLVMTSLESDDEGTRAFAMGADDFVRKPFRQTELCARVKSQLRIRGYVEELGKKERYANVVLELTQALCSTLEFRGVLFTVVRRIAEVTRARRCSIVIVRQHSDVGYVIAQSDDQAERDVRVDLSQLPELRQVMHTREPQMITGAVSRAFLDLVPEGGPPEEALRSIALFPIVFEEKSMGVLFLHGFDEPSAPGEQELFVARTLASTVAISLHNARILQSIRDETEQVTFARAEAERRLSALQRYADFFEAAADGIVVVDVRARVLFSNPRAHAILGKSRQELAEGSLLDLIEPKHHALIIDTHRAFREQRPLNRIDLTMKREENDSGALRILSVSFSVVLLDERDALLISFRDVTADRENASELIRTKEFLERVIDASTSAIVSTDMAGKVLVWSRAAEQMWGYEAKEVVGQKNIRDFYPPGQSTRIRRTLYSRAFGGQGRLEGYRTHVIARDGSYIPVYLSAVLIQQHGWPVGCVSLLTDLRDHLRVEIRLTAAEEALRAREKEVLIHELAGAAAHELNQPLTSVLGYAALIKKRSEDRLAVSYATGVIINEAERMASIVRKIGKITRYETKSYVGAARILDIDRSSEEEP